MRHSTAALVAGLLVFLACIPLLIMGAEPQVVSASSPTLDGGSVLATLVPVPTAASLELVRGLAHTPTIGKTQGVFMYVRVSHYWPPLGGTNCFSFVNGECISKMSACYYYVGDQCITAKPNGEKYTGLAWEDGVDWGVACPPEWSYDTTVEVDGHIWTCRDRGGAIKFVDGIPWIDLLQEVADYPFGSIIKVKVTIL